VPSDAPWICEGVGRDEGYAHRASLAQGTTAGPPGGGLRIGTGK
jgi:hypothetical protein